MTSDLEREIERRLMSDPAIQEVLRAISPRQPRHRYWESPDGTMFIYTTENMGDGKYASAIYQPTGKGSRSGVKAKVTEWKPVREVRHGTRKAAKERALRLWTAHDRAHPEWGVAREAKREARNDAVRLRYFRKTGRWQERWGPVPAASDTLTLDTRDPFGPR